MFYGLDCRGSIKAISLLCSVYTGSGADCSMDKGGGDFPRGKGGREFPKISKWCMRPNIRADYLFEGLKSRQSFDMSTSRAYMK
jgi:hypothetical protein